MTDKRLPTPPNKFIKFLYRTPMRYLIGRLLLLLTTTGRVSGLPRTTPLQYEWVGEALYIGSASGEKADWYRNILADPQVAVQVGGRRLKAMAEPVTDTARIADFIELRLRRRPRIVGMILEHEGLGRHPTRKQLESYAADSAIVILRPIENHP